MVEGEPAYRVPLEHGGNCVAFVWPDSDAILWSHPLDVTACPAEGL